MATTTSRRARDVLMRAVEQVCAIAAPEMVAAASKIMRAQDLMEPAVYERSGDELTSRGLYLDMPPWGFHVFRLETL